MTISEWISLILVGCGGVLMVIGAVGMLRLPDFYSRIHAAGVTETLAALLIVLGLLIQAGFSQMSAKLLLILLFLWFSSPTAAHALAKAAWQAGVKPLHKDDTGAR